MADDFSRYLLLTLLGADFEDPFSIVISVLIVQTHKTILTTVSHTLQTMHKHSLISHASII